MFRISKLTQVFTEEINRGRELETVSLTFICNITPVFHIYKCPIKWKKLNMSHLSPPTVCKTTRQNWTTKDVWERTFLTATDLPESQYGKTECCLHACLWYIKAITLMMCCDLSCTWTIPIKCINMAIKYWLLIMCPYSKDHN